MDGGGRGSGSRPPSPEPASLGRPLPRPGSGGTGGTGSGGTAGRPAAANAARERSRVQTLRHAFLELQRTLPSVPPDTKLSKLDVLLLATTYIAHLTRSLQDDDQGAGAGEAGTGEAGPAALRAHGYLHPVKGGLSSALQDCLEQSDINTHKSPLHSSSRHLCPLETYTAELIRSSNKKEKWPMRSRLYIGATGQFLNHLVPGEKANPGETSTDSQT